MRKSNYLWLLLPSVVMQWILMILFFIIGYELFGC